MRRRTFLKTAAKMGAATLLSGSEAYATDGLWMRTWDAALAVLAGNVEKVPSFAEPVLFEGSVYRGIWQECGPHESLVYAGLAEYAAPRADGLTPVGVSLNAHRAFFVLQRQDGQLPAFMWTHVGFAQIQMVVPIAATAWELAQVAHDEEFLATAYGACSRWDAWLRRYRDTRGTGLVEAFCGYDTGEDGSPRWKGVPNQCPGGDARRCPEAPGLPRLCPDLSATVYGARVALAAMAEHLGKNDEAQRWREDAETIRRLIVEKLWCAEDASFYDVDAQGSFVRVRGEQDSRVLGEHVLRLEERGDRAIFEAVWKRQLHNPKAYWARYPLPSIAMDDPLFVRPIPWNSWGGASQALTALRSLRWMEHYGKDEAQRVLMHRWCQAILRDGTFKEQVDPWTGVFTKPAPGKPDPGGYSPAALVFLEFSRRLGKAPR
jgi:hypothetical protein